MTSLEIKAQINELGNRAAILEAQLKAATTLDEGLATQRELENVDNHRAKLNSQLSQTIESELALTRKKKG